MVTKQHSWANDGSFPIMSLSVTAPTPGLAACQTSFESSGHGLAAGEPTGLLSPSSQCQGFLPPQSVSAPPSPGPRALRRSWGKMCQRAGGQSPAQEQCGPLTSWSLLPCKQMKPAKPSPQGNRGCFGKCLS